MTFCTTCRQQVHLGVDAGRAAYYVAARAVRFIGVQDAGKWKAIPLHGIYVLHSAKCSGEVFSNELPLLRRKRRKPRVGDNRDRIPASLVRARKRRAGWSAQSSVHGVVR